MPIRTPTVKCLVNGAEHHITELTVVNQVNGMATARVTGFPRDAASATQASAKLNLGIAAAKAGQIQNYITTTERFEPDFLLTGSDGDGGNINFKGFLTAPGISLQGGSYSLVYNALHETAILDLFNGSAYRVYKTTNGVSTLDVFLPINILDFKGSVSIRIRQVLAALIAHRASNPDDSKGNQSEDEWALSNAQAARNLKVLPVLAKILNQSEEFTAYPELDALQDDDMLKDYMSGVLTSDGSFLDTLLSAFCPDFSLLFACDIIEDKTAVITKIDYSNMQPVPLEIPTESAGFECGDRFALPLSAVVVTGSVQIDPLNTSVEGQRVASQMSCVLGAYPRPITATMGTRVVSLSAPGWLRQYLDDGKAGGTDWYSLDPSIRGYEEAAAADAVAAKEDKNKKTAFLDAWAKNKHAYLRLLGSTASLNIPLNFKIKVGVCYNVTTTDGQAVFTGFASRMTHTLKVDERAGLAVTNIMFTHVRAPGFSAKSASPAAGSLYSMTTRLGPSSHLTSSGGISATSRL